MIFRRSSPHLRSPIRTYAIDSSAPVGTLARAFMRSPSLPRSLADGWETVPASANWSYSHNAVSRPAYNDHENWIFHESMTTDGPGGFGAGTLDTVSADGRSITLGFEPVFPAANIVGATVQ